MADENFDLTPLMAPYFDAHMMGPLLDFLKNDVRKSNGEPLYDGRTITKEKIKIIKKTNMLELLEDEYRNFPDDAEMVAEYESQRADLEARIDGVYTQLDNPSEDVNRVTNFFADTALLQELAENQYVLTIENVSADYGITPEALESYYKFSKFKYDCGSYVDAELMLQNYKKISQGSNSALLAALWGRLACLILTAKWDEAVSAFEAVKSAIDSRSLSPLDQLRQRAWLLHWALFVFINLEDGPDKLANLLMERQYLQTIENLCPWLLRYYAAAIILISSERRRSHLRDALREISSMSYLYSDPVTQFLESLFKNFDFDEAKKSLEDCQKLIKQDFFLQIFADKFTTEARVLICEMYCNINRRIDLHMLAEKLQLSEDEAERWMVNMIRGVTEGTTVDARIDSAAGQVIMAPPSKSGYQQVAEKTREMTARSEILSNNLQKILPDQSLFIKHRKSC